MTVFYSAGVDIGAAGASAAGRVAALPAVALSGAAGLLAGSRVLFGALGGGGVVVVAQVQQVTIPAAWQSVTLAAGYIAPMTAALDLVRGAVGIYDAASGSLSIGGRVLIGYAGKVFTFGAASSADYWLAINRQRAARELELMQGMVGADLAAFKARKNASLQTVAARVVKAAEKMSDGRRAALLVESGFCLNKWGA